MFPSIARDVVLEAKSRRYFGLPSSSSIDEAAAGGVDTACRIGSSDIGEPVTDDALALEGFFGNFSSNQKVGETVGDSVIGAAVTGASEVGAVELIAATAGASVRSCCIGVSFGELICGIETIGAFEEGAVVRG